MVYMLTPSFLHSLCPIGMPSSGAYVTGDTMKTLYVCICEISRGDYEHSGPVCMRGHLLISQMHYDNVFDLQTY